MGIKTKLVIDLPDDVDYTQHVNNIKNQISRINGLETIVSLQTIDDPISLSPTNIRKVSEAND
ncbi:MAG: hypothetical protein M0R17_05545 [Candidatus Omnitrophica bacterium]|jgi:hypothetical protein|nr:hypothetical protein [Candidatus Omnitrophota bacterium]